MPPGNQQDQKLLQQALSQSERVLARLRGCAAPPAGSAAATGVGPSELTEADERLRVAADAARKLLLDIAAALDKVPGATSDSETSPGGTCAHDRD
jgi:hypothetical protein